MNTRVYEDYKYSMQDVSSLYIGTKYTLDEIVEAEEITFKFRLIVERYILSEADREDTLETHLYYLDPKSFLVKIYGQLKGRVKVNVIEEKKGLGGKRRREYVTRVWPIEQLVKIPPAEKEEKGVIVQELILSKLALMAF